MYPALRNQNWYPETHKEARVYPLYPLGHPRRGKTRPYHGVFTTEQNKAIADRALQWQERNEQVKTDLGIEFDYEYIGYTVMPDGWQCDQWKIHGPNGFTSDYYAGIGHRCYFVIDYSPRLRVGAVTIPPSAMDILACVRGDWTRNATFAEWCCEFGYDTDSCRAHDIYAACIEEEREFNRRVMPVHKLDEYGPLEQW